ncbi:ABC transporter permease subunit [Bacillus sp. BP-3]|uniref:ABC transporter permease subunit n=1 Tax=Bacillus sp. BP-3 TaxID=3022773 RepID=UPI00232E8002|nr:ABC transporter permease subunit [Bacillus sp. BP-3]MDC2867074.1 ABC transporter permease subunit [Bacillus sp. BP-3]
MKAIWKSKRFVLGLTYIVVLVIASFIYGFYFKEDTLKPMRLLYDENGELIAASPFSPKQMPPLGSDRFGESIFYQILDGAKFTILFAIGISLLRVLLGTILGVLLSLYVTRLKSFIKTCTEVFYYLPTVFIAYLLMQPMNKMFFSNLDSKLEVNFSLLSYQAIVLVLVVLPTITTYVSSEIDEFIKQEYILSSQLMGASRIHIVCTHLRVLLKDRLFLLFMQHIIQTLLLITHLALVSQFIGGVQKKSADFGEDKFISLSNDWAGLIGLNYFELNISIWIVFSTLVALFLTILILKLMTTGIQDALAKQEYSIKKIERKKETSQYKKDKQSFTFANKPEHPYRSPANM